MKEVEFTVVEDESTSDLNIDTTVKPRELEFDVHEFIDLNDKAEDVSERVRIEDMFDEEDASWLTMRLERLLSIVALGNCQKGLQIAEKDDDHMRQVRGSS